MISTWIVFAITALTIFAYAQGKLRTEIISITLITSLILLFHIAGYSKPKLLKSFSNPALITVISMLIISRAIIINNSFSIINKLILHKYNNYPWFTVVTLLSIAFTCSLCISNTPIVAIFIPLMTLIADKFNIATSKLMIPLAFTTSLSGMITTIASSTNLLIHRKLSEMGYKIGIFDFIVPGTIVVGVSLIYTIVILPRVLPDNKPISKQLFTDKFVVKVTLPHESEFIGKKIGNVINPQQVIALQSNKNYFYKFDEINLNAGDVIFLSTTKEELIHLLNNKAGLVIKNSEYASKEGKIKAELVIREIMVPPNSYMSGKKLDSVEYYSSAKVFALGIQRSSNLISNNLHTTVLKAGDRILLVGDNESIKQFTKNYQLIGTDTDSLHIPKHTYAQLANLIFGCVIGATALKILPIMVSSVLGVSALLLSKCISIKQNRLST
ncbi:MAG: SLC13 family permease [Rickettsiaceae bacterium H1]|nr:SLC13 family permease [Rickettsiaceae bacterium H1]